MPATVGHVLSATTPDDPSFEIQPQHWNSNHAVTLNVLATEISGLFSNANGVSFGTTDGKITASYTQSTHAHTEYSFADSNGLAWGTNGSTVTGSYSQSTHAHSAFVFSNSNGVSFGTDGSTVTATVGTNYAGVGETVGTVAGTDLALTVNTDGVSIAYPKWLTTARASTDAVGLNTAQTNVTWTVNSAGISLNAGAYLTTAALSNHSHGNPTLALTNLSGTTASNSAGLTLSLSAADAGGAGPAQSFYMWPDEIQNSSVYQCQQSTSHIQPIYLPYAMSISYIRFPVTMSCVGSMASIATAVNVTRGMTMSSTCNVGFYTQGTGASSKSLVSYATGSATWVQRATYQAAGTGSHWSSGHTISFPREGGNTDFTSSAGTTLTNVTINSSQLSNFTGLRFIDVPFATSLPAGAYWFLFGCSTSGSSSGTANVSTLRILASNFAATQVNQAFNLMGSATNSSNHFRQGLGSWTTNTIGTIPNSIALANISTSASNPIMPFQLIRQA